jgi:general secretion pathway protein K
VLRNNATDKGVFRNLLQSQSYDPELINAVLDWMDSDSEARPGGAEDIDYLQLPTPYRAANQKMTSVDELRLVRGFTPEMVEKLRPFLAALPTATDINVNTAPPEVLSALFSVPVSSLSDFISNQLQHPYTDVSQVNQQIQRVLTGNTRLPTYGIKSDYFYVDVDSQFGRYRGTTRTLINRQQGAASQVLWHSRRLPADIAAALAKTLKNSSTSPAGNI